MHLRGQMLAMGEHYHVFNRGAHKQDIFSSKEDYDRFQILLYLLNTEASVLTREVLKKYRGRSSVNIFLNESPEHSLVDVLSYALMSNHFHLVLRQKSEEGTSRFMKKICTAYSMYFNKKYEHSGVLFQGRFKANHIDNEAYFRYIFSYVHLNPIELVQPNWKESGIRNPKGVRSFLSGYKYSSYYDYCVAERPEGAILSQTDIPTFLKTDDDLEDLLRWESKGAKLFTEDRPL